MPTCQPPASVQVEGTGQAVTGLWSTCLGVPTWLTPCPSRHGPCTLFGPCACLVSIRSFIHSFYSLSPCQSHY